MADRYGLEIRSATVADAPGLAELVSGFGAAVSTRVMAERLDTLRQSAGAVLIAVEWGPPSGVLALSWRAVLQADLPVAEITTLFVRNEDRRPGVARLLLKAGARSARAAGCGALQLLAPPHTPELEAFCHATGFRETATAFERALRKRV